MNGDAKESLLINILIKNLLFTDEDLECFEIVHMHDNYVMSKYRDGMNDSDFIYLITSDGKVELLFENYNV